MSENANQIDSTEVEIDREALAAELEQITGTDLPEAQAEWEAAEKAVREMRLAAISNPISLANLRTVADAAEEAVMELVSQRDQLPQTRGNRRGWDI